MKVNALTNLDSLLDTRLGFLYHEDREYLEKQLTNKTWTTRKHDRHFKDGSFHRRFANRTITCLRGAPMTKVVRVLQEFKVTNGLISDRNPQPKEAGVLVNYWPYKLTQGAVDGLQVAISKQTTIPFESVKLINKPPIELTVEFINENNIDLVVDYAAVQWLDTLAEAGNFKKKAIPHVTVIAPMIDDRPAVAPIESSNTEIDPFEALEMLVSPFANLQLFAVDTFCLITK
jgi:hypothetical protein